MAKIPANPKIYHITHVRNLPNIVRVGALWSDAKRIDRGLHCEIVGMSHIKQRRLKKIDVSCHRGTDVGDYVPFYFCPRSIMLYILHKGNHPDLNYTEGQGPIVHLQSDLLGTVHWARRRAVRWAFSDRNAGAYYANFYSDLSQLDQVNWSAVKASQWRDASIKDGKQAEFLVHDSFPWELVERIGVLDSTVAQQVKRAIASGSHQPAILAKSDWYY